MAALSRIAVYPIKSLDPVVPDRVRVTSDGGLSGDRRYAVVDADGAFVNGKRTPAVHRLRTTFDLEAEAVTVGVEGTDEPARYALANGDDRARLEAWLGDFFGEPVHLGRADGPNFTDSSAGSGPTLVSTATLREVASWFPGLEPADLRGRLRPSLEVSGVPAFWEDRLVADPSYPDRVRIGGVVLEGVKPVPRCVVPTRDPTSGEADAGFRRTFVRRRRGTLPAWADVDAFEHLYSLTVVTTVPEESRGGELATGDAVTVPDGATIDPPVR